MCTGIGLSLIPVGVAWRMVPLHLPSFWYKYGGSVLWAAMVYWLVAAILPRIPAVGVGLMAGALIAGIEFSRLYHAPVIDAFRLTLAGKLILGRFFSLRNIVAHWLAITVAAMADGLWNARHRQGVHPAV